MKKHYKVKEVNKTKLKSYLKDADKSSDKRNNRSVRSERSDPKRNNIY